MLYDGSNTLTYDAEGHVSTSASSSGGVTSYTYDAEGERIAKTVGGVETDFVRDLDGTLLDTWVSGSYMSPTQPQELWIGGMHYGSVYVYLKDGVPAQLPGTALANWLGTTTMSSYTTGPNDDATGVPTYVFASQPFGDAQTDIVGSGLNDDIYFTGKERDAESGNDYFGARYYDSSMGRFMSPDPQGNSYADFSDPQSWNLYAYVMNNPTGFTDPTGMYCYYGDTDFTSEQGQKDQLDPTQWDYHSNSKECTTNGGRWYDDAFTHGGFDDAGRPDYAVSANTQGSSSPQPSAWQAAYDFQVSSSSGLRDDELNLVMTKLLPSQFDGRPISFSTEDPYRFFGTHYCGPGGSGSTVGALDPACKVHDACYEAAPGGGISAANNYNPSQPMTTAQAAQAKQCNQALYDAARSHPDVPGSKAVQWWMVNGSQFPGNGLYILFPGTEAVPW